MRTLDEWNDLMEDQKTKELSAASYSMISVFVYSQKTSIIK
ncbi:MAG: hypothetical protein WBO70_08375 [Erysipelotrichaceae bacterium]